VFITFEGGDGSGKSTHAATLERRFRESHVEALLVREPGSTALGQYLREWLKRESATVPVAELLLFEAARAQLVAEVVRPALASGQVVIADRFSDSSLAYQGYGRGLDLGLIRTLNGAATGGLTPDLTVLLHTPVSEALVRATRGRADAGQRKFEDLPDRFHQRVVAGFLELASQEPGRWVVVDSSRDVSTVEAEVWSAVQARLRR
jgi:dTMP kinase